MTTLTDNLAASTDAAHAVFEARDGWRKFGGSVFYTSPVERFTVILTPVPPTENNVGYVASSIASVVRG